MARVSIRGRTPLERDRQYTGYGWDTEGAEHTTYPGLNEIGIGLHTPHLQLAGFVRALDMLYRSTFAELQRVRTRVATLERSILPRFCQGYHTPEFMYGEDAMLAPARTYLHPSGITSRELYPPPLHVDVVVISYDHR
uniref:Uncharacterized protein n=1 Tax=Oryza meridionalis TaxID=40149 RepID=A0A0E0EJ66_9ORYZ